MTTKQISENVGKTERSVQMWAKKTGAKVSSIGEKISLVQKTNKPADYDLEETLAIIETGLGKNAALLYRENARGKGSSTEIAKLPSSETVITTRDFIALIPNIVAETVKQIIPLLSVQNAKPETKVLPFIPEIPVRKQIANVVNEWVMAKTKDHTKEDFERAYQRLYKEFGDRFGIDVTRRAENRGIKPIEYLEREGKLEELYLVAIRIFVGANR